MDEIFAACQNITHTNNLLGCFEQTPLELHLHIKVCYMQTGEVDTFSTVLVENKDPNASDQARTLAFYP